MVSLPHCYVTAGNAADAKHQSKPQSEGNVTITGGNTTII